MSEVPEPAPTDGEVVVDVEHVGLCGTDLHIAAAEHPRARPPLILGHEIVGRVGSGQHAGRRVLVNPLLPCGRCLSCRRATPHACARLRLIGIDVDGGLVERIAVAADALHPVPDQLDSVSAALGEPLAVAVHAMQRGRVVAGEHVAVIGAGPVGLLLALLARDRGAHVLLVEPAAERARVAAELGFELLEATDPATDLASRTGGDLVDVVFDAAAVAPVAALVTQLVRPQGRIVVVGSYGQPTAVDLQAVTFGELELIGTRVYTSTDLSDALQALLGLHEHVATIVTEVVALEQVDRALDDLRNGRGIKVLVDLEGAA